LYCHCLELVLKAFLLARGWEIESLKRKIGHNLEKALRLAREYDLHKVTIVSPEEEEVISEANSHYSSKKFQYFSVIYATTAYRDRPDLTVLDSLCARLVAALHAACLEAT
jgi:hypothetical protein